MYLSGLTHDSLVMDFYILVDIDGEKCLRRIGVIIRIGTLCQEDIIDVLLLPKLNE